MSNNTNPPLLTGAATEAQKRNAAVIAKGGKGIEAEVFGAICRWYNRRENGLHAVVLHADGSMS